MKVHRKATNGRAEIELDAANLDAVSRQLDATFPGIRFRIIDEHDRIRKHIRFFVNSDMAHDLSHVLSSGDDVKIVCALSGG